MRKLTKNKKGQLITGLVGGIAALIILVIVSLLIVDTLNGADLISKAKNTTEDVDLQVNTIPGGVELPACVAAVDGGAVGLVSVYNNTEHTNYDLANFTVTGCNITYVGTDVLYNNSIVNVSYSYEADSVQQISVDNMVVNYTSGVDNISEKLPTVLLIAAVVLLFGAIVFLVQRSRTVTATQGGSI